MVPLTRYSRVTSVPRVIPKVHGVLPTWANSCSDPGGKQGRLLPPSYSQEAAEVTALVTCPERSAPASLRLPTAGGHRHREGAAEVG